MKRKENKNREETEEKTRKERINEEMKRIKNYAMWNKKERIN
jgi:hypothetical protein